MAKVPCGTCKGTGKLIIIIQSGGKSTTVERDCALCGGTGKVGHKS